MGKATATEIAVERLEASAYTVPTDSPESDGTLSWDSTTMVVVGATGGGKRGLGYTYGDVSVGTFVESKLAGVVEGTEAMSPPAAWAAGAGASACAAWLVAGRGPWVLLPSPTGSRDGPCASGTTCSACAA